MEMEGGTRSQRVNTKERKDKMFEQILLAIDGSADSYEALKYARDLALRDDAEVIVVHAFAPIPEYLGDPQRSEMTKKYTSAGRKVAQRVAGQLEEKGVDVTIDVLEGPAAEAILEVADTRQPDLIVMGSEGHGDLSSLLLGSVSHRVLAHAETPVLIAKA